MSPWEGSDPGDGWGHSWGPGASLSCMENLAGPRAALPTLPECKVGRPSADGRNALKLEIQHGGVSPILCTHPRSTTIP